MSSPAFHPVIQQHIDEAALLALRRRDAVTASQFDLEDLGRLDDRLEAHLDGLIVTGDVGWATALAELQQWREPGEAFAATVLAFERDTGARLDRILTLVESAPEAGEGLAAAFAWLDWHKIASFAEPLVRSDLPVLRQAALGAVIAHRDAVPAAMAQALVKTALDDPDPAVRAQALRAPGACGWAEMRDRCLAIGTSSETERFWAAWSAACLGDRDTAPQRLIPFLSADGAVGAEARRLLPCLLSGEAFQDRLTRVFRSDPRAAIQMTGAHGNPAYLNWLLDVMADAALARPAGEAVSLITGLDLAYEDYETDAPAEAQTGPTDDPDDPTVAMDPDADLPWPDQAKLRAWWQQAQAHGSAAGPLLCGKDRADPATPRAVLRSGLQRQRKLAALIEALADPAKPLFNTEAPAPRQRAMLETTTS